MEATPSLASISDDGSYDLSTGPITPDTSPLFCPTETGIIVENHLAQFLTDAAVTKQKGGRHGANNPERPLSRRSHVAIRNVCFIGAGYVGKWVEEDPNPKSTTLPSVSHVELL
jgi:hypothetical protein